MTKSELLQALQSEIRRHDFSTFLTETPSMANGGPGVVLPGCPPCAFVGALMTSNWHVVAVIDGVVHDTYWDELTVVGIGNSA
jgi:hypothetical protein